MLFVNLLISTTTLIALVLSLFIFISNPKKRENQSLAFFVFAIFLWLLANLLTNLSPTEDVALFFGRTTLIGAALIPYAFLMFVKFFLGDRLTWRTFVGWGILPFVILLTTPTDLNISSIEAHGLSVRTGDAYFALVVELFLYFGIGLRKLYRKYKNPHTNATQRSQIQYMFAGTIITAFPAIVINAILPIIITGDTAILYGPNVVILLAIFTSIAIVKHRLLDIRLVVARSLAYVLLLGTMVSVYALIVFVFTQQITFSEKQAFIKDSIPFFAAILIALSFGPLKKFFDRLTNKYFYQDAYDPQAFLDELNKILVSTLDLKALLNGVSAQINANLKSQFTVFSIKDAAHTEGRIVGGHKDMIDAQDAKTLLSLASETHQKSMMTDYLDDNSKLKNLLNKYDIAMIIRLSSSTDSQEKGLGYVMLGPKKSGGPYGDQDTRMMDIVTNELAIAIQNALRFEEIQNFTITLQEKVDDATYKLRKTNEKLRALDETKDEFISMASHQLRTPLTSMKGYVSMVLEGDSGKISAMQRKLLDQAFVSSQRMVYLIADLLNVSRLKTGKFVIDATPTNLADVIEGEISQLVETAKSRHLELTYKKPEDFPTLMLDETKIRQVIMNFVDNAIYYTPSGGHIQVNLADKGDSIEFTVVDDGLGVPKADQHHLFSKFYRAGNAKKARPDGTGLGLFMAKKVIVAQGGAVVFRSQEGKGSTFGFSFPKVALKVKPSKSPEQTKTNQKAKAEVFTT